MANIGQIFQQLGTILTSPEFQQMITTANQTIQDVQTKTAGLPPEEQEKVENAMMARVCATFQCPDPNCSFCLANKTKYQEQTDETAKEFIEENGLDTELTESIQNTIEVIKSQLAPMMATAEVNDDETK